tara:strand:- start:120 stop:266 length:147 start_codon:yes stop_codon:yes gene_type:complete
MGAKVIIINKVLENENLLNKNIITQRFKNYSLDELRISSAGLLIMKNR